MKFVPIFPFNFSRFAFLVFKRKCDPWPFTKYDHWIWYSENSFLLKFLVDTCVLFWGQWYPCFWISGDVSSGFHGQAKLGLIILVDSWHQKIKLNQTLYSLQIEQFQTNHQGIFWYVFVAGKLDRLHTVMHKIAYSQSHAMPKMNAQCLFDHIVIAFYKAWPLKVPLIKSENVQVHTSNVVVNSPKGLLAHNIL